MDAPERIFVAWPQPNATGLAFTLNAWNRTHYVRADLLTAATARAEAAEAAAKTARDDALREAAERMYPQIRSLISRVEASNAILALINKEPT